MYNKYLQFCMDTWLYLFLSVFATGHDIPSSLRIYMYHYYRYHDEKDIFVLDIVTRQTVKVIENFPLLVLKKLTFLLLFVPNSCRILDQTINFTDHLYEETSARFISFTLTVL